MAINFELKSVSQRKNATAPLYCSVREKEVRCKFRTDIMVSVADYAAAFHRGASQKARNAYNGSAEGIRVEAEKNVVRAQVMAAIAEGINDAAAIADRVRKVLVLNEANEKAAEAEKLSCSSVLPYMDNFIKKAEAGEIKNSRRKDFDPATLQHYRNLKRYFSKYIGEHNKYLTFDDITEDMADGFIKYMEDLHFMVSSMRDVLSCMAAICRRAWNAGLISPAKVGVTELWKMPTPKEEEMRATFALSDAEVDALWELSNSGKYKGMDLLVIDMTLAGIYSMQRYSDFSIFDKSMVRNVEGRKFLHFRQDKTDNVVDVPLVGRLDAVMARNDYDFTKLDPKTGKWVTKCKYQIFGKRLRKILCELSDEVPTLKEMLPTILSHGEIKMEKHFQELLKAKQEGKVKTASNDYYVLMRDTKIQIANGCMGTDYLWKRNGRGEVVKAKWTLVNSHVCRRTGITLALDHGFLTDDQIRKISGHKTLKAFRKYDKRDVRKVNANIYDALARAEAADRAKVVDMKIAQ